jgi:hypothetical protein
MKPKKPELYDIWQEEEPAIPELPWRMQLLNYIAQYPSKEAAEKHKAAIEFERKKMINLENLRKK